MTASGVLAGVLGGFLTSVAWVLLIKEHVLGLYEAIPGFVVGFLLIYVVSRLGTGHAASAAGPGERSA